MFGYPGLLLPPIRLALTEHGEVYDYDTATAGLIFAFRRKTLFGSYWLLIIWRRAYFAP
jgi:hypothetical protein